MANTNTTEFKESDVKLLLAIVRHATSPIVVDVNAVCAEMGQVRGSVNNSVSRLRKRYGLDVSLAGNAVFAKKNMPKNSPNKRSYEADEKVEGNEEDTKLVKSVSSPKASPKKIKSGVSKASREPNSAESSAMVLESDHVLEKEKSQCLSAEENVK